MKKRIKLPLAVVAVLVLAVSGYLVCAISGVFESMGKDVAFNKTHIEFVVEETDVSDHTFSTKLPLKNDAVYSISYETRLEIAQYMKNNNLKLKAGVQYIPKKTITNGESREASLDEHLEALNFEKIQITDIVK